MAWPHRFALRSYLPWWWAPPRMPWFGQPFGHLWTTIQGCREWHPIVKVRHLIDQVLPSHPEKLNTLKHYITTCPVDNSIFQTMSGASPYLLQTRLCLSLILLNCLYGNCVYMSTTCHHQSQGVSANMPRWGFSLPTTRSSGTMKRWRLKSRSPKEVSHHIVHHCNTIYKYTYHISYIHINIYIYMHIIYHIYIILHTHTYTHTHTLIIYIYIYIYHIHIYTIYYLYNGSWQFGYVWPMSCVAAGLMTCLTTTPQQV